MHGGTNPGAPVGNQNAVGHGAPDDNQNARKHGLFAKCLNEHGKEVYQQAKDASGEELQRDSAEFLIAQIAQAFETNEHIDKAKNQVEEAILAMIEQETISPKYGYSLINRMRQPDIGTLGKALAPLKGLLDKKKEDELATEDRDDDGMSIVPADSDDWQKYAGG